MPKQYKMLINGKWFAGKETIDVINPYNQEVLGTIPKATKEDVNAAIESAQQAFEIISNMPAHQRSKILEKTSEKLFE